MDFQLEKIKHLKEIITDSNKISFGDLDQLRNQMRLFLGQIDGHEIIEIKEYFTELLKELEIYMNEIKSVKEEFVEKVEMYLESQEDEMFSIE
jgi:hypothetical protein